MTDRPADDALLPRGTLAPDRDARLFVTHAPLMERLRDERTARRLAPDELLHPDPPCDLVVRRGNLRISELLADGREVTRAVLQAGAACRVRTGDGDIGDTGDSPLYSLASTMLMALGEVEVWILPAGAVDTR
jgi:hypothetical protein